MIHDGRRRKRTNKTEEKECLPNRYSYISIQSRLSDIDVDGRCRRYGEDVNILQYYLENLLCEEQAVGWNRGS